MGNQIDRVIPGLYVGGFYGSKKEKLKENNITHVLAIHDTANPEHPTVSDFVYKCIKVSDTSSSNLSVYFAECVDFIHECRLGGGAVYVHCAAGISRSVTITVMYLMTVSPLNFEESLTVVQFCREVANPNYGFRLQLRQYEENGLDKERQRVREKYPHTHTLNDEQILRELLSSAQEKLGQETRSSHQSSRDPFPFDPETFTRKKSD